jgi:hypothetical protein
MLHAGLDLSRKRIDVCLLSEQGELVAEFATPSDGDGVCALARRVLERGEPVQGVIESALFGLAPPEPASNVAWSSRSGGN